MTKDYSIWINGSNEAKQDSILNTFKQRGIKFKSYKEYIKYINKFKPFRKNKVDSNGRSILK